MYCKIKSDIKHKDYFANLSKFGVRMPSISCQYIIENYTMTTGHGEDLGHVALKVFVFNQN